MDRWSGNLIIKNDDGVKRLRLFFDSGDALEIVLSAPRANPRLLSVGSPAPETGTCVVLLVVKNIPEEFAKLARMIADLKKIKSAYPYRNADIIIWKLTNMLEDHPFADKVRLLLDPANQILLRWAPAESPALDEALLDRYTGEGNSGL